MDIFCSDQCRCRDCYNNNKNLPNREEFPNDDTQVLPIEAENEEVIITEESAESFQEKLDFVMRFLINPETVKDVS